MGKGAQKEVGHTYIATNGYQYTKVELGNWRLTHHIIAERKLGRPLKKGERVRFKDLDRTNLNPDNIEVNPRGQSGKERKIAQLKARIEELQGELDELENS